MGNEGLGMKKESKQCCCKNNRSFTHLVTYAILVLFLAGSFLSLYVFSLSNECTKWDQQSQKKYLELKKELEDLKRKVYSPEEYIIRRRDPTTLAQEMNKKSSEILGHLQKQSYGRSKRSENSTYEGACNCTGEPGLRGLVGLPGRDGYPGPRGLPGLKGDACIPGLRGVEGLHGSKGERGDHGFPGIPGPQGLPGYDGMKGQKGELGNTGFTGHVGPRGYPGNPGRPGTSTFGDSGSRGYPGSICRPVGQNNTGISSDFGPQLCNVECQCPRGHQGESGQPGEKGEIGHPGLDGIPGRPARPADFDDSGRTGYPGMICRPITQNDKGRRSENEHQNSSVVYQCPSGPQGPPGLKGEKGDSAPGDRTKSIASVNDDSLGGQGYYPWAPKWSNTYKT